MMVSSSRLAVLCVLLIGFHFTQLARAQSSNLQCEHQYCRATGTVGMDNETYPYTVPSNADFQLVITLKSTKGDVDLAVASPHGTSVRLSSAKAKDSRKDTMNFSREELREDPGVYTITVVSNASVESEYTLDIQEAETSAGQQLHKEDEAALQKVFKQCCEDKDACPTLNRVLKDKDMELCEAVPNQCNDDGHLTHLSLSSEGLDCRFPKELSSLKSLTRLDLTFNQMDGSLGEDVGPAVEGLHSLEHLSLGFNALDGELTCMLLGSEERGLHELDLAHNRIEGTIPQCLLGAQGPQEIYLADNELSGSLPSIPEGSPLTALSVSDQANASACPMPMKGKGLSGDIPSFRGAEGLRALRLNRNSFTGQLPSLPAGIREVRVQQNQLRGPVPPGYGDLEQLHTLKAESNKLSGSIPSGLAGLQALQIVDLSLNRLTGSLPSTWDAPKLVELDLHGNALSGGLPASLAQLPRLSYLQLQDNDLKGDLAAYAEALSGSELPSTTRYFSIGGNQLTGSVPPALHQLGAFQPGSWAILDGLLFKKTMNLSGNALSGALPVWALHAMSADEGLTVNLVGNKWICPSEDTIDVCTSMDEIMLGDLTCSDAGGLAGSATSRHSVLDMLRIMPGSEDCPGIEAEAVNDAEFEVAKEGKMLPGFKVNFGAADRGVSLEDFNGKPIWDAAWGESDYDEEEEDEDEDEDDAPWGQANKRAEGILQLPEQDTLKEKEEAEEAPVGDVDLPDWAPGHKVKTLGQSKKEGVADIDVDLPDWAPGHKTSRSIHPSQPERAGQAYQWAQDDSPHGDARHDIAGRQHEAEGDVQHAAAHQQTDVDHRQSPSQGAGLHLPEGGATGLTLQGSKQEVKATERPQEAAARSSAMFLAVFVVLLGLLAALGVVAVWRAYQRRQGVQHEGLAMEAGMAGLELQKSGSGSDEGLGGAGEEEALLEGRKGAIINLHAQAGGATPADIAAYAPPRL